MSMEMTHDCINIQCELLGDDTLINLV